MANGAQTDWARLRKLIADLEGAEDGNLDPVSIEALVNLAVQATKGPVAKGLGHEGAEGPDHPDDAELKGRGPTGKRDALPMPAFHISRPVIVVPGIMGSRLFERTAGGATEPLWPPETLSISDAMKRLANARRDHVLAPTPLPFVYDGLIAYLTGLGYVPGRSLFVFPYNWTQSNADSGAQLLSRIEAWKDASGSPTFDVVCHSMGGIVTRSAFVEAAAHQEAPIERVSYIASPHYGAPKAYFALHPDIDFKFVATGPVTGLIERFIWRRVLREQDDPEELEEAIAALASQMPSVFELLPDPYYFEQGDFVVAVQRLLRLGERYEDWGTTYVTGLSRLPDTDIAKVTRAMAFKSSLGREPVPTAPGKRQIIYANAFATNDRITYRDFRGPVLSAGFSSPGDDDSGRGGDGTVPAKSGKSYFAPRDRITDTHVPMPNNSTTQAVVGGFLASTP